MDFYQVFVVYDRPGDDRRYACCPVWAQSHGQAAVHARQYLDDVKRAALPARTTVLFVQRCVGPAAKAEGVVSPEGTIYVYRWTGKAVKFELHMKENY